MYITKDFKIKKIVRPIIDNIKLEDPRLIESNNKYYIVCTEYINSTYKPPVILLFDKNLNYINKIYFNLSNYKPKNLFNRNWCPFIHNGAIFVHTDSYPLWNVYKIDLDNGEMYEVISEDVREFFNVKGYLRCSTSWKKFEHNTYICGLHIKILSMSKIPCYRTILVEIDMNTLKPIKKTNEFCIDTEDHSRIQFLSGLEIKDNYVILSYGIGDYKLVIQKISKIRLRKLLDHQG
jgi:predicted GH43/DUF377 family glycosyl hydrolase